MFEQFININQPTIDIILQIYLITDYISCALSCSSFHSVFIKTFIKDGSKRRLIKKLLKIWFCLFKKYKITSMYIVYINCNVNRIFMYFVVRIIIYLKYQIILGQNVEFIKRLIINLEHAIYKILKSIVNDCVQLQFEKFINKIKNDIKKYEQSILENVVNLALNNICQPHNSNKKRGLDIEYTPLEKSKKLKVNISIKKSSKKTINKEPNLQSFKVNMLNNKHDVQNDHQKYNSDQNLLKKPKSLLIDAENILHESNKSGVLLKTFCFSFYNIKIFKVRLL